MKKSLCLLSVTLIALSSCSKDDKKPNVETLNVENSVLPKTVKRTYISDTDSNYSNNYTATFIYDGTKIKSLTYVGGYSDGSEKRFTYTGNTITEMKKYDKDKVLQSTTTLTYENNKIKSYIYDTPYGKGKTNYTYNANGTISADYLVVNPITGVETKSSSNVYSLDVRGNIVKVSFINDGWSTEIEYDTKNSPYKNIPGYTLLLDAREVFDQDGINTINNIVNKSEKNEKGTTQSTATYENIYDNNNFSIKSVKKNSESKDSEIYEYTY